MKRETLQGILKLHDENVDSTEVLIDKLRTYEDRSVQDLISHYDQGAKDDHAKDAFETSIRDLTVNNRLNLSSDELNKISILINDLTQNNGRNNDQQILSGSTQKGGGLLEQTRTFLTRGHASDRTDAQGSEREEQDILVREDQALGIYIQEFELKIPLPSGIQIGEGGENKVYGSNANEVLKINNGKLNSTRLKLLDRWIIHNNLLPNTAYKLLGFNGDKIILGQPYIHSLTAASESEIIDDLTQKGFEWMDSKTDMGGQFKGLFNGRLIIISDLFKNHGEQPNVLKLPDGTLSYIDPNIRYAE